MSQGNTKPSEAQQFSQPLQQQTRTSKITASVFGLIQEVTTSFRRGTSEVTNFFRPSVMKTKPL